MPRRRTAPAPDSAAAAGGFKKIKVSKYKKPRTILYGRRVAIAIESSPPTQSKFSIAEWGRITRRDLPETFVNDKREYYRTEYLKSEHWAELRQRKLAASPVCEVCGSRIRVEPHHLRYKNLYDVELDDLKTLCRKHHREEHRRLDEEKRSAKHDRPPQTPKQSLQQCVKFKIGDRCRSSSGQRLIDVIKEGDTIIRTEIDHPDGFQSREKIRNGVVKYVREIQASAANNRIEFGVVKNT
jgi:hypothetical protein